MKGQMDEERTNKTSVGGHCCKVEAITIRLEDKEEKRSKTTNAPRVEENQKSCRGMHLRAFRAKLWRQAIKNQEAIKVRCRIPETLTEEVYSRLIAHLISCSFLDRHICLFVASSTGSHI